MSQPGVIHDIGYQRYQGARLGRGYAAGSLLTHSLRTAYGLGRSAKAKVFPWLAAGIIGIVAVVLTAIRAVTGEAQLTYLDFSDAVFPLVVLFCAVVAPELVSRDLRSGVLSLYFSRPLRRTDYALAKLAALAGAIWLLLVGPMLLMFVGGVFTVDGWSAIWNEIVDLGGGLAYAALHAVVVGAVSLLIASLVSRRAVAAPIVVAAFLVTLPIVGLLEEIGSQTAQQLSGLFSPATVLVGVRVWLAPSPDSMDLGDFGPLYGAVAVALLATCVGLLLVRYRKVRA
ncbi:MAG: ABC transporter permease [Natronosporangium sp.]